MKFVLGIDFGASFIKMGLVDQRGRIRRRLSVPIRRALSQKALFEEICSAAESLIASGGLKPKDLLGIGVGVPGLVDPTRGVIRVLTHVRGWRNIPLASQMRRRLHLPTFIDNDANLMALGEAAYGAARGCKQVICLTLGTGIGGGILVDGELYHGGSFSAGEIGHIPVIREGALCECGGRGCLELYVGIRAIVESAKKKLKETRSAILPKLLNGHWSRLTPKTLHEAAKRGDRVALGVWEEVGGWLGFTLAGLVNVFNPERIVIGGGVSNAGEVLLRPIRRTLRRRALDWPSRHVAVVRAKLGNDAGIIGASVLVRDRFSKRTGPPFA